MVGGVATVSRLHRLRDPLLPTGRVLRWGVVGSGSVAQKVVADLALLPDAVTTAIAARTPVRSGPIAAKFGIAVVESGEDAAGRLVLRDDVDVVYIATPHNLHADQARAALAGGKHVLVEKPFTVTASEADELVSRARSGGLFLMEALWTRFLPVVQEALAVIHSGELGEIRQVRADLGFPVPYRPDDRIWNPATAGGALLEMGTYPFSWATSVLGEPAQLSAVSARAENGVEAQTSATLDYPGGGRAELTASFLAYCASDVTVAGSRAFLRTARPLHSPASFVVSASDGSAREQSGPRVGNGYVYELREVTERIQSGERESALMPLDESVFSMRLFDQVRSAAGARG